MKTSGIYSITNTINGKIYYGSSSNIEKRWYEHKNPLNRNKHSNIHLQRAWLKYGESAFKFTIIKEVPTEQLLDTEQEYLDKVKEQPELYYNQSLNAESPMRGRKQSEETITKRVLKLIGQKRSVEAKNNISLSLKGRVISKDWKYKLSLSHIGITPTNHDKNIYIFKNIITEQVFEGKRVDLAHKFNLNLNLLSKVIKGKRKSHGNWILITQ